MRLVRGMKPGSSITDFYLDGHITKTASFYPIEVKFGAGIERDVALNLRATLAARRE